MCTKWHTWAAVTGLLFVGLMLSIGSGCRATRYKGLSSSELGYRGRDLITIPCVVDGFFELVGVCNAPKDVEGKIGHLARWASVINWCGIREGHGLRGEHGKSSRLGHKFLSIDFGRWMHPNYLLAHDLLIGKPTSRSHWFVNQIFFGGKTVLPYKVWKVGQQMARWRAGDVP
jgi:hypothetical protein